METQRRIMWGIKCRNRHRTWLWDEAFSTMQQANNEILEIWHGEIIPTFSASLRGFTLRKIKWENGLEIVKVELVEVMTDGRP